MEKSNCFSIYKRSDLNKIREETIKKKGMIWLTDQITRKFIEFSNMVIHIQAYRFANNSVMA